MPISGISAASRSRPPGLCLVLPALLLNYFGQGALVLADPAAIENPFYRMVPDMLAAADGRAGDGGDRDREPGGDHRRLFAGRSRRSSSACCRASRSAHLGERMPARSISRA